jgi:hypothetical protein
MDRRTEGLRVLLSGRVCGRRRLVSASIGPSPQGAIYRRPVVDTVRWSRSLVACPHGPTALLTLVASPRTPRPSLADRKATSTFQTAPVVAGRARSTASTPSGVLIANRRRGTGR